MEKNVILSYGKQEKDLEGKGVIVKDAQGKCYHLRKKQVIDGSYQINEKDELNGIDMESDSDYNENDEGDEEGAKNGKEGGEHLGEGEREGQSNAENNNENADSNGSDVDMNSSSTSSSLSDKDMMEINEELNELNKEAIEEDKIQYEAFKKNLGNKAQTEESN